MHYCRRQPRLKVIAAAKVNANVFFIMVLLLYMSGCYFRSRSLFLWYSKTGGKARRILTKIVAEFCTCLTYCNIFVFCFCMLRPFRLHFSCNAMSQCCTRISYAQPGSRVSLCSRTIYILIFNTMPDFIKYRPPCSSAGLSDSLFDASEHDDKIKNCAP